jgi:L-ascorbate metabolism protein UlaG (beta-lactamase superfamily)
MDHQFIHWLGHASFRVEDGEQSIYIDPWKLPPSCPPASLILITHPHYDHLSLPDIKRIATPETVVLATADAAKQIPLDCKLVHPGQALSALLWRIETVAAYTLKSTSHLKAHGWVGYTVTLKNGMTVFHSGDTDRTPELEAVRADVALLACGGTYTMNGAEAGEAANRIAPRLVIPMHWGDIVGSRSEAEIVRNTFTGDTVIKEPER